jgi:tRNA pseudouridine55 synthase
MEDPRQALFRQDVRLILPELAQGGGPRRKATWWRGRSEARMDPRDGCTSFPSTTICDRGPPPRAKLREEVERITLSATVSKGTYIRSLARDIAIALGTVGHVTMLRRTKAGPFDLSHAISLDKLADLAKARSLDGAVLPLSAGLDDIPALPVTPAEATLLRHGQKLMRTLATPGLHLATDAGRPVALVEAGTDGLTVVRGFNI